MKPLLSFSVIIALGLLLLMPQRAVAADVDISSFTLNNGMRVVLVENHRIPAIYHSIWLPVGGADDPAGKSGLAHFMEHMMFQGSDNLEPGEFSKHIAGMGGQQNASTGRDYTTFYVKISRKHIEKVMQLEAERFAHMNPPPANFNKEREVIMEERRAVLDNNPSAKLTEQINAALFLHHPYQNPIIGWKNEMEGLTRDDVLAFHKAHYHAGNMLLLVAGDITRDELQPLAEKYYGSFPARSRSSHNWVDEPEHRAALWVKMRDAQVKQPTFRRSYIAPSVVYGETAHTMPLLVLEHLLGSEGTGYFYRTLVADKKVASSIAAGYQAFSFGPGRFTIYATPADGITMQELERHIDDALADFIAQTPDKDEITRAKTILKADTIYAQDSLQGVGSFIGYLYMLGLDESYFFNWQRNVDAVTAEQIAQAARALFVPEKSATGWLLPVETENGGAQ